MAWLSFLKSKDFDPAQFEKELSTLARRISQKERNVSKLRYQTTRIRRLLLVYGSLGYLILLLYLCFVSGLDWRAVSMVQWCLVAFSPAGLVLMTKGITTLYSMRIDRTETTIQVLKDEHMGKIEELKEKTKFSSTQALLNRFADGGDRSAELDEELQEKQRQLDEIKKLSLEQEETVKSFKAYPHTTQSSRGWFDLVVDSLIGSDELSPNNRYALICTKCLSHNGLAPPGKEADQVKYRCPTCGFLNGVEQIAVANGPGGETKPQAQIQQIPEHMNLSESPTQSPIDKKEI